MKKDIAHEKIKKIYGNCRPYDSNVKMYVNYKDTNIISYMEDIIKNIIDTDDEITQLILDCAVMNILEQLVYMRELYDKGISKSEYVKKLFCKYIRSFLYSDDSSIYHFSKARWENLGESDLINMLKGRKPDDQLLDGDIIQRGEDFLSIMETSFRLRLQARKNANTKKYMTYKYDRIFSVYEDYLVKKSDKGYRTNVSKSYLNIILALFDVINPCNMKDIIEYNLPKTMPIEGIKKLYKYVRQNVLDLNFESNLSELLIIERLFGFINISKIIKSDKSQEEKMGLADVLQIIRFFGYTPLHQYVIDNYTLDENNYFYSFIHDAHEAVNVAMQSIVWSILKRFEKNDKRIEDRKKVLNLFIDYLKKYIKKRNITICDSQVDIFNKNENDLYNRFLIDGEELDCFKGSFIEISKNLKGYKDLMIVLFRKYCMGAEITCRKKDGKYLFEDDYSMTKYVDIIFSTDSENEKDFQYKDELSIENDDDDDDYYKCSTYTFSLEEGSCIKYVDLGRRINY